MNNMEAKEFNKMEYGKTDWINYRQLKKGEKILDTDEVLEDKKGWRKTICAGGLVPDPQFTSHRMYRRLKKYKDWELLECLPKGWKIDKTVGSPLYGYQFCTNGKSVLNGQKRALVKVISDSGIYVIKEKNKES